MPLPRCWRGADTTRGAMLSWWMAGVVAAMLVLPVRAGAAPFCVRTPSVPSRCLYVDAGECRTSARAQGGECVTNPAEPRPVAGTGRYCIVVSGGTLECEYPDRSPCERAAARMGSGCVEAPRTGGGEAPLADPFRAVRPY